MKKSIKAAFFLSIAVFCNAQAAPVLLDTSFETSSIGDNNRNAYQYNTTSTAWIFSGNSGIAGSNSDFTLNSTAPDGSKVAFLQSRNSVSGSISQQFNLSSVSNVGFDFFASDRANRGNQNLSFQVLADSNVIGIFNPVGPSFMQYFTSSILLSAGTHTLTFKGLAINGDKSVLLDKINATVSPVPIPAAVWLFGSGLVGLLSFDKKKKC